MFGLMFFLLMGVWIDWDDAILVLKGLKSNRHGIATGIKPSTMASDGISTRICRDCSL